jgi:hypothetical protein
LPPEWTNFIVVQNKFKNTFGSGIYLSGTVYGVAAQNQFDRVAMPIRAMGKDYSSWNNLTQEYGTAENFFFEDNNIYFSSYWPTDFPGWIETGQGGRIVVRYNSWDETNNTQASEYWDVHGLQTPPVCMGYWSIRIR